MVSGARARGILLEKPEMQYQEMEYGFMMLDAVLPEDRVPETTLWKTISKSYAMVCAGLGL